MENENKRLSPQQIILVQLFLGLHGGISIFNTKMPMSFERVKVLLSVKYEEPDLNLIDNKVN